MRLEIRLAYPQTRTLPRFAAIAFFVVVASCSGESVNRIPLPRLPEGAVVLRVAHVVNPRLERLSADQLQALMRQTEATVRDHFGTDLRLEMIDSLSILTLFRTRPVAVLKRRSDEIVDIEGDTGAREKLIQSVERQLRRNDGSLPEQVRFARPYLGEVPLNSFRDLATALADTLLDRFGIWRSLTAEDGHSLINVIPYNEWIYWDSFGYGELPYDVVITNQIIASVEYTSQTIHTALRGGLTMGTASYSKTSRYGTYVFFSTFPFIGTNGFLSELRNRESYNAEEFTRLASAGLAHEIGHQLFHFGHPYGNPACIMSPVPLLEFREWYERLDATKCRVGSEPAMTPGAIEIYYDAGL